ncbi:ABC transporter permease [Brevibacterium litoralis]|uniref:ABC transporter permease n=1 Tax=Brevibacterium litoralis TaxID=3138935 RepID=UPI0032EE761C
MNTALTWWQVALAGVLVLATLALMSLVRVPGRGRMVWACVRMTAQLVLVGLVLGWVFAHPSPWLIGLVLLVMEVFAVWTVLGRLPENPPPGLRWVVSGGLVAGTVVSLAWFLLLVMTPDPWFDPRFVIPVAGMLLGAAMTGIALAVKNLGEGMEVRRAEIEDSLALGAAVPVAVRPVVAQAFESAVLPQVTSMLGTGIVILPGMMTGQILAGQDPFAAIGYQIAVLLGQLGTVGICTFLVLRFGAGRYFTTRGMLRD